jgi:hypothetical protein
MYFNDIIKRQSGAWAYVALSKMTSLLAQPLDKAQLQNRMDDLQDMIAKLISAISLKSQEINLLFKTVSGKVVKLKNAHAKTTLKELYENLIPKEGRLEFLRFGNRVFDPNVLTWPDGRLRTVESVLNGYDELVQVHDGKFKVISHVGSEIREIVTIYFNPDFPKEKLFRQIEDGVS